MSIYLDPKTVPSGIGLPSSSQALINFIAQYMAVAGASSGSAVIGSSTPTDTSAIWYRLDSSNNPIGEYIYTNGAWRPMNLKIGMVAMWYGDPSSLPNDRNWLLCQPSFYGGNPRDSFGNAVTIPDLSNRFVVGAGVGTSYGLGSTGGADTVALSTGNLPAHTHSIPSLSGSTNTTGAHTHELSPTLYTGFNGPTVLNGHWYGGFNSSTPINISSSGDHSHSVTTNASTTGSGDGVAGTAHENRPPYYALAYIIHVG